jgi:hypothetical protein
VVCSSPPEGRARWTVRLLTEEVIKRKLVPRVGRETIRVLLNIALRYEMRDNNDRSILNSATDGSEDVLTFRSLPE